MPELYSEYDGLAEKWATPLHTTSGLTKDSPAYLQYIMSKKLIKVVTNTNNI